MGYIVFAVVFIVVAALVVGATGRAGSTGSYRPRRAGNRSWWAGGADGGGGDGWGSGDSGGSSCGGGGCGGGGGGGS